MRVPLSVLIILIGTHVMNTGAQAQDYPWCAYYSTGDGNSTNCGFVTREQCMASVSGVGGQCEPNNFYVQRSRRNSIAPQAQPPIK